MRQRNEHTIANCCQVDGRGYWSGQKVRVRMYPASVGTGLVMVRTDLVEKPMLQVGLATRQEHQLRTVLASGQAKFAMVEHLLASLYALEIDNCVIEVNAEELPGLDGSAAAYVDALRSAGLVIQAAARKQLIVDRTVRVGTAASWLEVSPTHGQASQFEYVLDYGPDSPIRAQTFRSTIGPHEFSTQIAPARTFVTSEQVQQLRAAGVAEHVSPQDLLVFDQAGPVQNRLRFDDECARHKLLDLVGDLSLINCEFIGRIVSHRGGHALNAVMAKKLLQIAQRTTDKLFRKAG